MEDIGASPQFAKLIVLALAFTFGGASIQVEDLYCLAIVHKRGIKSLRDLNRSHLPLLRTILAEGRAAIQHKFNLPHSRIR